MLHSPQNLSKCTNTTKGSTSICWMIWPNSKHFKDSLEKRANLWGFKNSWKKWLLRYFQIHWKIYEHLNSFVSIGLQTLFFILNAYVWLQLYDYITYSTMLWLCYFQLDSYLSVELMSQCFTVMISTSQQLEIRCHRKDSILPIRCQPQKVKGKLNFIGLAWVLALRN